MVQNRVLPLQPVQRSWHYALRSCFYTMHISISKTLSEFRKGASSSMLTFVTSSKHAIVHLNVVIQKGSEQFNAYFCYVYRTDHCLSEYCGSDGELPQLLYLFFLAFEGKHYWFFILSERLNLHDASLRRVDTLLWCYGSSQLTLVPNVHYQFIEIISLKAAIQKIFFSLNQSQ